MMRRFFSIGLLASFPLLTQCHTRPEPNLAPVEKAWAYVSSGDYSKGLTYINTEVQTREARALEQERQQRFFSARKSGSDADTLNTVASLLWLKQQCLRGENRLSAAEPVWEELFSKYPHAAFSPPLGRRTHPALEARMEWQKYRLLHAARSGHWEGYSLPMDTAFDAPVFSWFLQAAGNELLEQGEYDHLEAALHTFTTGEPWRQVWLSSAAVALLDGAVRAADDASETVWKRRRTKIGQWIAAKPDSTVAKIALALHQIEFAAQAVGGESDDRGEQRWDLYRERLKVARPLIEAMPADSPVWYTVQIRLNRTNLTTLKDVAKEGMTKYPWFAPLFIETLHAYLPRWSGEAGEWQGFALEVGQRYGAEHYAVLYLDALADQGLKGIDPKRVNFPLLKKGLEQRLKAAPRDSWAANALALFAWKCGDQPTARESLAALGDSPNPAFWEGLEKEYAEAKAWVAKP